MSSTTTRMTGPPEQPETFNPRIPDTVEECGLPLRLLLDLFIRRVYMDGTATLRGMCDALKLSPSVIHYAFQYYRSERLLDVRSTTEDDYIFSLTTAGRKLAANRLRISQYVGPAPVSLRHYSESVRLQRPNLRITREQIRTVLSDLVITEELVEGLGPALTSQRTMFLYGPTGTGKTAIAERLHRIYDDAVLVPYAIEVDGQIIVIFDPMVHRRVEEQPNDIDARWVLCRRPFMIVGGELTADMLELRLDDTSRTYAPPVQMKANLGMLVIDDFGRQVLSPRRLLNRWIVPLDRRIDFLSLRYGFKFEVPFETMLVFATNLDPHRLGDAAFLRRLRNKIYVQPVSDEVFDEIFRRYTAEHRLDCEPDAAAYARQLCRDAGCKTLPACLPSDLCSAALSVNDFNDRTRFLSHVDLEKGASLVFARTTSFEDDTSAQPPSRY